MNELMIAKTMSSLEIATLTGKHHKNVLRDIRKILDELYGSDLSSEQIQGVTIIPNDQSQTKEILLDKDHSLTLMTGYDAKMRMAVNRRWQELEEKQIDPMKALNDPAIMRSLDGSQCITDAAKALKLNPKSLFQHLQSIKWIYKRVGGKNWLGYQDKIQQGLIEHKVTTVSRSDGSEKIIEQALLTPKGITKFSLLLGQC